MKNLWTIALIPALLAGCGAGASDSPDPVSTMSQPPSEPTHSVAVRTPAAKVVTPTRKPTKAPAAKTTTKPRPKKTRKPTPEPATVYYASCAAARAAGAAPLHRGDPGYRSGLDRDNDGVACE